VDSADLDEDIIRVAGLLVSVPIARLVRVDDPGGEPILVGRPLAGPAHERLHPILDNILIGHGNGLRGRLLTWSLPRLILPTTLPRDMLVEPVSILLSLGQTGGVQVIGKCACIQAIPALTPGAAGS